MRTIMIEVPLTDHEEALVRHVAAFSESTLEAQTRALLLQDASACADGNAELFARYLIAQQVDCAKGLRRQPVK